MTISPADRRPDTDAQLAVERWSATSGSDRPSRANLTLISGGHRWRANATGNGAIDNALAPLLGAGVELVSYDVHATGTGHHAKASVSVGVRRREEPDAPIYPGRALHASVLHASLDAYLDAINTLLADEGVDVAATPSPRATAVHATDPNFARGVKDRIMSSYYS